MILSELQQHLEALYELGVEQNVTDYLITDAGHADRLSRGPAGRERLFLRQDEGSLDIGLYVDGKILNTLEDHDPFVALHSGNINDFLIALEGVSHFLCVLWNGRYDRQVTQLELELQAEIDKYVTAAALIGSGRSQGLHALLFDNPVFDAALAKPELERYRDANQLAAKYCRQLEQRFRPVRRDPDLLVELRRFYRLPRGEKLRRILTN